MIKNVLNFYLSFKSKNITCKHCIILCYLFLFFFQNFSTQICIYLHINIFFANVLTCYIYVHTLSKAFVVVACVIRVFFFFYIILAWHWLTYFILCPDSLSWVELAAWLATFFQPSYVCMAICMALCVCVSLWNKKT